MKQVLVIGDVMLDKYVWGRSTRLSPEAPVPIFDADGEVTTCLGGAANVAANLACLDPCGTKVFLYGNIGDKSAGDIAEFRNLCSKNSIELHEKVFEDEKIVTKTRYIDRSNLHQVGLRLDNDLRAVREPLDKKVLLELINSYMFDAIIFSDYCKGCFDDVNRTVEIVNRSCEKGVFTFLDSRREDLSIFFGIHYFKPNSKEFSKFINTSEYRSQQFMFILKTSSENGMSLYNYGNLITTQEGIKVPVVDPTGAGDVALAGFVYGLISGHSKVDSVRIANNLAALSCSKFGTYVCTENELLEILDKLMLRGVNEKEKETT